MIINITLANFYLTNQSQIHCSEHFDLKKNEKQRFQKKWEQSKAAGTLESQLNLPKIRTHRAAADKLLNAEKAEEFKLE